MVLFCFLFCDVFLKYYFLINCLSRMCLLMSGNIKFEFVNDGSLLGKTMVISVAPSGSDKTHACSRIFDVF